MDQKPNQAADSPAPATDPTIEPTSHQDPTTAVEQGNGAVAAETQDVNEVSPTDAAPKEAEGSERPRSEADAAEADASEAVASEPAEAS
jgi:hypothetical protein